MEHPDNRRRASNVLDGAFVDVTTMEKILKPFVLFVCRHNTGRSQMAEAYLRLYPQVTGMLS